MKLKVKHYLVTWQIDAIGDLPSTAETFSPTDAAKYALAVMQDKESTATIFDVKDTETGQTFTVDLQELK